MISSAASRADEDRNVDVTAAIKWLNTAVINNIGHALKEPEIVILRGTWRGLTYEQMSHNSEYSTNYLMRDVAPKLWKQLSNVFGRSVGKTNFRVALEAYVTTHATIEPEVDYYEPIDPIIPSPLPQPTTDSMATDGTAMEAGLYWHPAVASEPRGLGEGISPWLSPSEQIMGASYVSPLPPRVVPTKMYGYTDELALAEQWLTEAAMGAEGHCSLLGIWGLGGVGKTLLTETLVSKVGNQFNSVIWRSLQERPTFQDLSSSILTSLGVIPNPTQLKEQLVSTMSQKSILIVLEGIEAILQPGDLAGGYRPGYQTYGDFFQLGAGLRSCVIVTGIEGPAELRHQGQYNGQYDSSEYTGQSLRSLTLTHLSDQAATELLQAQSLSDVNQWPALIKRYQGHPLALKSASRVIREIFNGRVDDFLQQSAVLFTDILRLLAPSFNRLSFPELDILYWLASQDTPSSLSELQRTLPLTLSSEKLISALDSLKQRFLLEVQTTLEVEPTTRAPTFCLSPLVKAYAVHQFMEQLNDVAHARSAYTRSGNGTAPVINLSQSVATPVQLSQWFQGQFEIDWHTLERLFDSVTHPAMRLRSVYHLREKTFIKRCKLVVLGTQSRVLGTQSQAKLPTRELQNNVNGANAKETKQVVKAANEASAFLLLAIHQENETRYKVCVQVQPVPTEGSLPASLTIRLLDPQQDVLASITAQADDSYIQLPFFRGALADSFSIELGLGEHHHGEHYHRETFIL